jgi:Mg2+-importing ATPase
MYKISSPPLEEIFSELKSSATGLSNAEAAKRLEEQNKHLKKESRFKRELKLFVRQFTSPLVLLLLVAVILSGILGETTDMLILLFILLATGFLSFFQELNAGRAVEKLQEMIHPVATVLREGKAIDIKTSEVVSGDILLFNGGDIVPTDCRIVESNELFVNESALTGESYPEEKKKGEVDENAPTASKKNCLWKGTNIVNGTARAVAVNLGKDTLFGRMQKSLQQSTETIFEKGIKKFGYFLLRITLVLSAIVLAINLIFHRPFIDSILFSLAIAVGMAPELLPAIMTLSMTAGAKRMLKKKVIVKKLSSIFNFGEINILCTDKTGTITEGSVRVKEIVNADGKTDENLKRLAFLNASLQSGFANPIDDAIKELNADMSGYKKVDEIPYDFTRRRLSVLVKKNDSGMLITKGAFTNVLSVCDQLETNGSVSKIDEAKKSELEKKFQESSENGLRVLAVCKKNISSSSVKKEDESQMTFAGFIFLEDPLKEGVQQSIEKLKQLNVEIKIITGDNKYIAAYTARELGMDDSKIITGDMLSQISPDALSAKAIESGVFAEIEPNQKETIIKALQKAGKAVAYMGDGINDVAAIHAADTGISVNDAVDVARESADFVLLEKNLDVLTDGIYEGRRSFVNSMKYILITTGATFGNMFSIAGASLLLPFLPMLPKQILLTNLITDFPFLAVASDNIDKEQTERPRKWNIKMIRSFMLVFGIHSSLFDFLTFYVMYFYFKLNESAFQTSWFIESVMTELLILFIVRTRRSFIKSRPGNMLLIIGIISAIVTVLLTLPPFGPLLGFSIPHTKQVIAIIIILLLYVITADLLKIYFFRKLPHPHSFSEDKKG